jgi:hypothetical protein
MSILLLTLNSSNVQLWRQGDGITRSNHSAICRRALITRSNHSAIYRRRNHQQQSLRYLQESANLWELRARLILQCFGFNTLTRQILPDILIEKCAALTLYMAQCLRCLWTILAMYSAVLASLSVDVMLELLWRVFKTVNIQVDHKC